MDHFELDVSKLEFYFQIYEKLANEEKKLILFVLIAKRLSKLIQNISLFAQRDARV